jgi:hypothetical protein
MTDLLGTFRQKAEDLASAINSRGGIRATIDGLRRQMAEADRRRAVSRAKSELKRLDDQIAEMITAVGVQAVGLHRSGHLNSPELQPLCQHIVELEAAVEQQKAELAALVAQSSGEAVAAPSGAICAACGKPLQEGGTFCPHCGEPVPPPAQFCAFCGSSMRPGARFCAHCGRSTGG